MASATSQESICKIVQDRILTLETEAGSSPAFRGFVLMEDKLIVTDIRARNLQSYNRQDGKRISASDRLESPPWDVCILNDAQVAVCLDDVGKIVVLSVKDLKPVKTINLRREGFYFYCLSVVKWGSDQIIVSGGNDTDDMLCWCFVSVERGKVESTHDICKWGGGLTYLAVKDSTLYVSCSTSDSRTRGITRTSDSRTCGVYFYNLLNPGQPNFVYKHQDLQDPRSVVTDMSYVYVYDYKSNTLHQLTLSGQLVTIHKMPSSDKINRMFYDVRHGNLYTTRYEDKVLTVYKMEYPAGVPVEILNMDDRSIQIFKDALKDGNETTYNIRIMVVGPFNVGKSTLVRRILGDKVNISERHSTEGIDVCVNFCDFSSLTKEWTKQERDSEQDYTLRRLVNLLNENYQTSSRAVDPKQDSIPPQLEITDQNPVVVVDFDKNKQILFQHSQQNIGLNNSSTANTPKESTSDVQRTDSQLDITMMTRKKVGESLTSESHKEDPLRQMLKVLKENKYKAIKDVGKYARVSIWDFAGQYSFYTTHQMFLTRCAIYLMVADVSGQFNDIVEDDCYLDTKGKMKCKVRELMDIWMNSIHSCAPPETEDLNASSTSSCTVMPPPVILVGTHVDQIKRRNRHEHGQKYLKDIRSYLSGRPVELHLVDEDFALDNSVIDSRLKRLKMKIIEAASQQPYWGEQIPTRWFLLEQQLMSIRDAGMKVIARSTVEQLNKEGTVQIKDSEELDLFLKYLHETGVVIYFSIENLRDIIILVPQWLIEALKTLINAHSGLPGRTAKTGSQSSSGSQPHIPTYSNAGSISNSNISTDIQQWLDFKEKGILTTELVDAIWTQDKHPDLHAHKDHLLRLMEQFNIIAKPRSFDENGVKEETYYLVPCMLRQEYPEEVTSLAQDPHSVSTPVLCCVFRGKYLPPPIFHRLIAACITRWPVAKKKEENLIFCGCCVFDIDPLHRLTLQCKSHIIYARITRMVVADFKTLDEKLCSRVRKFINLNLSKITSYLGQNLQYDLCTQCPNLSLSPPFNMWIADEGHDPNMAITPENIKHARLIIALGTVCVRAIREIFRIEVLKNYKDINQALQVNKDKLTKGKKSLLNKEQSQLVFQKQVTLEQFDISLLYVLIRNVASLPAPSTGWGKATQDQPPRDTSLGASVERIRTYRNNISGHSSEAVTNQQDFLAYWGKIKDVLLDIESVIGGQTYSQALEKQWTQVISVYEAC